MSKFTLRTPEQQGRKTVMGEPLNPYLYLRWPQWVKALKRMRDRIANGLAKKEEDSNCIGDKYTEASWGMCSEDPKQWPDIEDYTWPSEYKNGKKARVLYRDKENGQHCPMDQAPSQNGCFYTCRLFKTRKYGPTSREQALELYDTTIEHAELLAKEYAEFERINFMRDDIKPENWL